MCGKFGASELANWQVQLDTIIFEHVLGVTHFDSYLCLVPHLSGEGCLDRIVPRWTQTESSGSE